MLLTLLDVCVVRVDFLEGFGFVKGRSLSFVSGRDEILTLEITLRVLNESEGRRGLN